MKEPLTSATTITSSGISTTSFFITVLTGVLVFVVGRFIEKFIIDPWKEQKVVFIEIMERILYYQDVLVIKSTEKERLLEANNSLKKLSIRLLSTTYAISWYSLVAKLTARPKISKILKVHFLLQSICRDINYMGDNWESFNLNNIDIQTVISGSYLRYQQNP